MDTLIHITKATHSIVGTPRLLFVMYSEYCRTGYFRGHDISRISRILTKPRKYHVREYDFKDLFAKNV